MTGSLSEWDDLPPGEQVRIIAGMKTLAHLSWRYSVPLIIGDDDQEAAVSSATGFAIALANSTYLVTAAHVVEEYRGRVGANRYTYITAGRLGFDPLDRIAYENRANDVAFVSLDGLTLTDLDADVYSPIGSWPPVHPKLGDAIQFCGFPKAFRGDLTGSEIDFGPLPAFGLVRTVGDNYCTCVIEREEVTRIGRGPDLPPATAFGGLSGSPVLLFGDLAYPIIGVVSEVSESFDIVRIATLSAIDFPPKPPVSATR